MEKQTPATWSHQEPASRYKELTKALGVVIAAERGAAADEVHNRRCRRRVAAIAVLAIQVQPYPAADAAVNEGALHAACQGLVVGVGWREERFSASWAAARLAAQAQPGRRSMLQRRQQDSRIAAGRPGRTHLAPARVRRRQEWQPRR